MIVHGRPCRPRRRARSRAPASRGSAAARAPRPSACRAAAECRARAAAPPCGEVVEDGLLVVDSSSPADRCSSRCRAARARSAPPPGCGRTRRRATRNSSGRTPVVCRDELGVGVDLRRLLVRVLAEVVVVHGVVRHQVTVRGDLAHEIAARHVLGPLPDEAANRSRRRSPSARAGPARRGSAACPLRSGPSSKDSSSSRGGRDG